MATANTTALRIVSRGEKLLNKWVGEKAITPAGKDWLIAALDPFHDTELKNLQGWPDVETGYSVVQKVKQSIALVNPGGIFAGINWDLWVVTTPQLDNRFMVRTVQRENNIINVDNNPVYQWGGVHAYAVLPGTVFDPFLATTVNLGQMEANVPFTNGVGRLIGIGVEGVNTTATLNKQGSVTVFKHMQQNEYQCTVFGKNTTAVYPLGLISHSATIYRHPPQTLQNVMLLPGSRTWDAAEGFYSVGCFHSNENPPHIPCYDVPILARVDDVEGGLANNTFWDMPQYAATAVPIGMTGVLAPLAVKQYPIHTMGQVFSGLSPTSSIVLNCNMYFERFVDQNQAELVVLATPSAEYDPLALEIYSHALSQMPPGVMFKDNPFGEWFADVIDQVANVISFIPHPIAQGLAAAGRGATTLYRGYEASQPKSAPQARKKTGKAKRNNYLLSQGSRTTPSGQKISGPLDRGSATVRKERVRRRVNKKLANG